VTLSCPKCSSPQIVIIPERGGNHLPLPNKAKCSNPKCGWAGLQSQLKKVEP